MRTNLRTATRTSTLLGLAFVLTTALTVAAAEPGGRWTGAIELPSGELGFAVTLEPGAGDGAWSGSIDIPAQGVHGFVLSNVAVDGDKVRFEMAGIPGTPTFDGTLAEPGDAIAGSLRQGRETLSFALVRSEELPVADSEPGSEAAAGEGAKAAGAAAEAAGEGVAGEWLGVLSVGPMKLRLALGVRTAEDGTLAARLDSLDQGAEVPVASVAFEGRTVRLGMPAAAAAYEGTMSADGGAIEGTWTQGGRALPLTFERQAERAALVRPQEPKPPFPYESREVTFRNQGAGLRLAGTFVVPAGEGPFPAVLFVTGSGPQDRDEMLMGHRPFLVIADHLARRGIASLRFDDRGFGGSEGDHMASTVADFATDVEAGLGFLTARAEVDGGAVGILGHSEGGVTGPRVAAASDAVRFLVLLAPPGVPLDDLVLRQAADVLRLRGVDEALIERAVRIQGVHLGLVRDESLSGEDLAARLLDRAATLRTEYDEEERAILGLDEAAVEQTIGVSTTPWFRSLMRLDPAVYLRRIDVPVLALFGEKDVQVAAEENADALRIALRAAARDDVDVRVLPDLNHLFQHAETGGIDEYGTIEETTAPQVLELIAGWIAERARGRR